MSDNRIKTKQLLFTISIGILFLVPIIAFILRGSETNPTPEEKNPIGIEEEDKGLELLEVNPRYEEPAVEGAQTSTKEVDIEVNENETEPEPEPEPISEKDKEPEEEEKEEEKKKAELVIKSYEIEGTKEEDSELTFEFVVENTGDKLADDVEWAFYYDEDKDPACEEDIEKIEPGDTEKVTCEYSFEKAGDYNTVFEIDIDDDIEEENENNNKKEIKVEIKEKKAADLVIDGYSFDPYPPEKDEKFEVTIGIKNIGDVSAKNFEWKWWSTDGSAVCTEEISVLSKNSTKNVKCEFTYNECGKFETRVEVDTDDDVDELDEDNNEYSENVEVSCD